jgi:mono/diheme cytochrome c family protein
MTRRSTAAALLLLFAGCAGAPLPRENLHQPAALLFNGYANPAANCYHCHGGDGSGTWRGANLAKRVPKLTEAQIREAIMQGKGIMPSFADKLSGSEVDQLVGWLKETFPEITPPKS